MTAGINTKPPIGVLRHGPRRHRDHLEIPVGSLVLTPSGLYVEVLGYRGGEQRRQGGPGSGKDHRVRLWCQYQCPANKRFDKVLLLPELVTVVRFGPAKEAA